MEATSPDPDVGLRVPDAGARLKRTRRDWAADWFGFVFAVVFGVAIFFADGMPDDAGTAQRVFVVATGAIACLSLWYRRRWPTQIAVALMVVGTFSSAVSGAMLVSLFTVAVMRPWKVPVVIGLAGLATSPIYFHLFPSSDPLWGELINLMVIEVAAIGWGMYLRARRALVESLRETARQAEADRDLRVSQAREQERTRIAREMHDVLAHRISLVALNAGAIEFRPDAPPEEIREAAAVVRASAHLALDELREVITVLRDPPQGELAARESPQPTLADVTSLIDECRQSGAEVEFDETVEELAEVPDATGRTAYRVVQEGLTNSRKHAPGGAAQVTLAGSPDQGLTVKVSNRRPLMEPEVPAGIPGSGTGLIGLSERVDLAGGRLDHGQRKDGRFTLEAWLPWTT